MRANVFRRNPVTSHDQKTSTGTGDNQSFARPKDAQGMFITVETTSCYISFDGTAPSSAKGLLLPTGVVHFFPLAPSDDPQIASSAGTSSKANVLWVN